MWRRLYTFIFRRRKRGLSPEQVAARLAQEAREEALAHARMLFAQGVWVRDLLPGEMPSEIPEIEDHPIEIKGIYKSFIPGQ